MVLILKNFGVRKGISKDSLEKIGLVIGSACLKGKKKVRTRRYFNASSLGIKSAM
jgi:hypothetical protein